ARQLRDLLRERRLPEAWIAPEHVLEARAWVRLYKDLLEERTSWRQRVRATLFHQGVPYFPLSRLEGQERLERAELSPSGRQAVEVGLRQAERLSGEMAPLRAHLERLSRTQKGCRALREAHYGVGPISSVAIWAEMGDPRRFSSSSDAVRHTGLDVTVYASDTQTKQRPSGTAGPRGAALGALRGGHAGVASQLSRPRLLLAGEAAAGRPAGRLLGCPQAGPALLPHPA